MSRFLRRALALPLATSLLAVSAASAPAGSRDRSVAESIIRRAKAQHKQSTLASREFGNAEEALRRAAAARSAGDLRHSRLLERLAVEWARCGVDLTSAASRERSAGQQERRLLLAQKKVLRGRALVEQATARVQRARAALRKLEQGEAPQTTPPEQEP